MAAAATRTADIAGRMAPVFVVDDMARAQPWFMFDIDSEQAVSLLRNAPEGSFLVRGSTLRDTLVLCYV